MKKALLKILVCAVVFAAVYFAVTGGFGFAVSGKFFDKQFRFRLEGHLQGAPNPLVIESKKL